MPLASFIQVPKRQNGQIVMGPDGKPVMGIAINPAKQHVRGFWLNDKNDPAPILAANEVRELKFLIDSQGHFDWSHIIGTSTSPYMIQFYDAGSNRRLQNRPIHSSTIVGSGQRPFRLPEPYFFNVGDSQREIIITVANILPGAADNEIWLSLYGRRFYHHEAPPATALDIAKRFGGGWRTYDYFLLPQETLSTGLVTAVAANGFATFTFNMDANADTDLQKLMVASTGAFSFELRERSTNRTLSNGRIHVDNGMGNAEFPFLFADTYLLERDRQLLLEVQDLSGYENSIYTTFAGRRLQYV